MFVFDIDFIVVNAKKFMKHSLVGPGCEKGSDDIFFPLGDDENGSLIFGVITGFFHQLIFHFDGDHPRNLSAGVGS